MKPAIWSRINWSTWLGGEYGYGFEGICETEGTWLSLLLLLLLSLLLLPLLSLLLFPLSLLFYCCGGNVCVNGLYCGNGWGNGFYCCDAVVVVGGWATVTVVVVDCGAGGCTCGIATGCCICGCGGTIGGTTGCVGCTTGCVGGTTGYTVGYWLLLVLTVTP